MPLSRRPASALSTSPMGEMTPGPTGTEPRPRARPAAVVGARVATVSTSVFHAAHDGHWPDHFGDSAPHCWQT
jgi:hypothetical protein